VSSHSGLPHIPDSCLDMSEAAREDEAEEKARRREVREGNLSLSLKQISHAIPLCIRR